MSRLFPEGLLVRLAPAEVPVAEQLRPLVPDRPCRVTVVLANALVRYAVIPWSDGLDTPAEEEAYVRHHFGKIYGERAREWDLRASQGADGAARLASAVDRSLVEEIRAAFPAGGKAKLVSVQPELMMRFNEWRGFIPSAGAWLVLAESGRACVALHGRRGWAGVANGKGAWLELLDRERYRVGEGAPELVLLAGAKAPDAAAHWKFRELAAQ